MPKWTRKEEDNKTKNVLMVGDLRTAGNYGANATSESLIDLLLTKVDNKHLKLIEHRSFYSATPEKGWPTLTQNSKNRCKHTLKKVLENLELLNMARAVRKKLKRTHEKVVYHVPFRLDDYESFTEEVMAGKQFQYEKKLLDWADVVVINSEGNIVNGTDENGIYRLGGLYVLYMAYLSKVVLNKTCYIINHTVDPKNRDVTEMIQSLYPQMDGIFVREKKSYKALEDLSVYNQEYIPDALFTHDFTKDNIMIDEHIKHGIDFSKPYICLGDTSGFKNRYNAVKWNVVEVYTELINELRKICPQIVFVDGFNGGNEDIYEVIKQNNLFSVNIDNCDYKMLYKVLSGAQIFVSGRWHASIISLIAHTPIILWGADSHKTEALYGEIDWPFRFFDVNTLPINIDRLCKEATKVLKYDCTETWKKVGELSVLARDNIKMIE